MTSSEGPILGPRKRHTLSPDLERALEAVAASLRPDDEFALMGGTALSEFYLAHRPSEDLDFFTLKAAALADVARELPALMERTFPGARVLRERVGPEFVRLRIDGAEVSPFDIELIRDAPPRFGEVVMVEGVPVASLLDIAEGKLSAFVSRREGKDMVDLWALQTFGGVSLTAIYPLIYAKDPGLAAHPISIAEALLAAASSPPLLPPTFVEIGAKQLQEFFRREYERFLASGLPPKE